MSSKCRHFGPVLLLVNTSRSLCTSMQGFTDSSGLVGYLSSIAAGVSAGMNKLTCISNTCHITCFIFSPFIQ